MKLPESTIHGRFADQSHLELYELDRMREFQVPVEELVVASRKIRRCSDPDSGSDFVTVSKIYSEETNSWRHKCQGDSADMHVDRLVCHRCGIEGKEMFVDHFAITPSAITCSKCLQGCKKFGKSGIFLKSCRCQACATHHSLALSEAFKSSSWKSVSREKLQLCAVCCLRCKSGIVCNGCGITMHKRCAKWIQNVNSRVGTQSQFLCRTCHPEEKDMSHLDVLVSGLAQVKCKAFTDFDLPQAFGSLPCTQPANKPIVALKPRGNPMRRVIRTSSSKPCDDATQQNRRRQDRRPQLTNNVISKVEQRCENGFTESCLRLLPYDPIKRSFEGIAKHQVEVTFGRQEVVRNFRSEESTKRKEKKTAVRAARASQRRIMKDVAAFGSSFLEFDALTGRESHLRFGRSGIHAWGVFADQEIREGEVIVEYRGEIIGNAIAEKREIEYEQAKIGSDYMFRMDCNTVCDATKRGNVARYINASCDPNCYTQIISINNSKRIVIYAKKDIPVGQELCYDYKFPVEFDEAKRVACCCGAKDCRGFMNWDKRYALVAAPAGHDTKSKPAAC
jgi:histone-lysine N-methyltransferase SETD1